MKIKTRDLESSKARKDAAEKAMSALDSLVLEEIRHLTRVGRKLHSKGPILVPQKLVVSNLGLRHHCVPGNKPHGPKSWLMGIIARRLEDAGLIAIFNNGNRTFFTLLLQ